MKKRLADKLLSPFWLFVEASVFQISLQIYLYYRYVIEGNAEALIHPFFVGIVSFVFSLIPVIFMPEEDEKGKKIPAYQKVLFTLFYTGITTWIVSAANASG